MKMALVSLIKVKKKSYDYTCNKQIDRNRLNV